MWAMSLGVSSISFFQNRDNMREVVGMAARGGGGAWGGDIPGRTGKGKFESLNY